MDKKTKTLAGLYLLGIAGVAASTFMFSTFVVNQKLGNMDNVENNKTLVQPRLVIPNPTIVAKPAVVPSTQPKTPLWKCKDVTSYDYNWQNDMYCTSSTGETRYTDYAGAARLEAL
jgi:hypothetical protein